MIGCDYAIFNKAAVRQLEFSKIAIFVMWRVSEHWKNRVNRTITPGDIAKIRFSTWRLSTILNFIFYIKQHVTVVEPKFESAHQISLKSDDSRPRYSDKPFSKWRPSAILNFQILAFLSRDLCLNVILLLHTKYRVNRTTKFGDMAKRRFSIWRPPAILSLQYFDTLSHGRP